MVERIEWFSPIHYEVLKFFDQHDIYISPRDLAVNIDYDRGYVGDVLREFQKVDMVNQKGQVYQLTDCGRAFLSGEIEPHKIEAQDPTD